MTITREQPSVIIVAEQPVPAASAPATNEMEQKLKQIMMEKLGLEESQLQEGASFTDDLGIDSLDVFELIIEVENVFHLSIPSEEAERLTTPGKLIDYIKTNGSMENI